MQGSFSLPRKGAPPIRPPPIGRPPDSGKRAARYKEAAIGLRGGVGAGSPIGASPNHIVFRGDLGRRAPNTNFVVVGSVARAKPRSFQRYLSSCSKRGSAMRWSIVRRPAAFCVGAGHICSHIYVGGVIT